MEQRNYEIGYDITGRRILLDEEGNYISYIPEHLSEEEALKRIQTGEFLLIQSKIKPKKVIIAPREDWPIFYAWNINNNNQSFIEFKENFQSANLTTEQEWEIINTWRNYMLTHKDSKVSLEEFRDKCIENVYKFNEPSNSFPTR